MIFILLLSIFLWLGGYFLTIRKTQNTGTLSGETGKIVAPPKWLYYAFGAPKSKTYPRGMMQVEAFQSQIAGVLLMLLVIFSRIWRMTDIQNAIGFGLCAIVTLLTTSHVVKYYSVKNRAINRRKEVV